MRDSGARPALALLHINLLVAAVAALPAAPRIRGSELQPYLASDVVAVAWVNLDQLDVQPALDELGPLAGASADQLTQFQQLATSVQSQVDRFRNLGVRRVYMLLRMGDVQHGGPTWVVPVTAEGKTQQIVRALRQLMPDDVQQEIPLLPAQFARIEDYLLAATNPEQLDALRRSRREAEDVREEVVAAIAELADHSAGLLIFGDADSRRVIGELFPRLPQPFDTIDGRLIANRIRWGGLSIDLPPRLQVRATIQLSDKETTSAVEAAIDDALKLGKSMLLEKQTSGQVPAEVVQVLRMLRPQVNQTRISLTLGDDPEEVATAARMLAEPIGAARRAAHRSQRINQFRQIALAMLNYHNSVKSYPPAASHDDEGRPLLSWRVAILPYLDQQALFDRFRLDEPWDSDHNRKLISLMPEIYADPDPAVRRAAGEGRTTYVVPTGENTVFRGPEGMQLKEIVDGATATVLQVEVVPGRAVIWTRPDDWKVDWSDPLNGVRRSDGRPFTASRCDGSTHVIANTFDPEEWAKLLTPAGGELID